MRQTVVQRQARGNETQVSHAAMSFEQPQHSAIQSGSETNNQGINVVSNDYDITTTVPSTPDGGVQRERSAFEDEQSDAKNMMASLQLHASDDGTSANVIGNEESQPDNTQNEQSHEPKKAKVGISTQRTRRFYKQQQQLSKSSNYFVKEAVKASKVSEAGDMVNETMKDEQE